MWMMEGSNPSEATLPAAAAACWPAAGSTCNALYLRAHGTGLRCMQALCIRSTAQDSVSQPLGGSHAAR
jgi:hypothetical protein